MTTTAEVPIRERFAARHDIPVGSPEPTEAIIDRLAAFATWPTHPIDRLTMVSAARIQEFLGISRDSWYWRTRPGEHVEGSPPPPRETTGMAGRRGRGAADLWCLEVDIIPWLLSTDLGRARLTRTIDDIKAGLTHPVFKVRDSGRDRGWYPSVAGFRTAEDAALAEAEA